MNVHTAEQSRHTYGLAQNGYLRIAPTAEAITEVMPMADYIDREAAMDAIHNHYEVRNPEQNALMDEVSMLIFRLPAADVRPVVRGKWKQYRKGIDLQCSRCYWSTDFGIPLNFCPNCGSYNGGDAE